MSMDESKEGVMVCEQGACRDDLGFGFGGLNLGGSEAVVQESER